MRTSTARSVVACVILLLSSPVQARPAPAGFGERFYNNVISGLRRFVAFGRAPWRSWRDPPRTRLSPNPTAGKSTAANSAKKGHPTPSRVEDRSKRAGALPSLATTQNKLKQGFQKLLSRFRKDKDSKRGTDEKQDKSDKQDSGDNDQAAKDDDQGGGVVGDADKKSADKDGPKEEGPRWRPEIAQSQAEGPAEAPGPPAGVGGEAGGPVDDGHGGPVITKPNIPVNEAPPTYKGGTTLVLRRSPDESRMRRNAVIAVQPAAASTNDAPSAKFVKRVQGQGSRRAGAGNRRMMIVKLKVRPKVALRRERSARKKRFAVP